MTLSTFIPYAFAAYGTCLAVGMLLRAQGTIERWAFAGGILALAVESLFSGLSAAAPAPDRMIQWEQWRLFVASFLPAPWLYFSLNYARGGKHPPSSSGLSLWIAALLVPALFVAASWEKVVLEWRYDAALGDWVLRIGIGALAVNAILLLSSIGVLLNLERTFRASVGAMRWRIKYLILGIALIFVARLYTTSQVVLFNATTPSLQTLDAAAALLGGILILPSLFRTGHFELEVYPSRTILQGSITIAVAGIYLLIIGIFAEAVVYFGGVSLFEYKALFILVLLVAFAVGLQSDRARLLVRRFVSRHFQRPVYDYRSVWRIFTEGTATKMDEADLGRALVRLIADLFQALSVSIWLVDSSSGDVVLAASTSLTEHSRPRSTPLREDISAVLTHLKSQPDSTDFEDNPAAWAVALRAMHPAVFHEGGHRVCAPIMCQGEVLGLITIGDRVGGVDFSVQDLDMLKCIAEHTAASVQNTQLSKKFLEAKELESFQAMAAFFVHDLKNAASTLNLMLKNLPEHFDDPEFRTDALRGIGKTVTHINDLIGRLNSLRQDLKLHRRATNLNELIARTLGQVSLPNGIEVIADVPPLSLVAIDGELIGNVLLNLILNGAEAMNGHGRLHISAHQLNTSTTLSVTDTGCGMTAEFMRHSLFRPFQTTKKNGLGIGMFQCKAIVEGHGGRIVVSSEPGKGTTVQIFLPTAAPSRATVPPRPEPATALADRATT